jgi:hypothetical protein
VQSRPDAFLPDLAMSLNNLGAALSAVARRRWRQRIEGREFRAESLRADFSMASGDRLHSALELSRPLHFGDYGGLPLKVIWALFDVLTILVIGSGAYLLASRHRLPLGNARINDGGEQPIG